MRLSCGRSEYRSACGYSSAMASADGRERNMRMIMVKSLVTHFEIYNRYYRFVPHMNRRGTNPDEMYSECFQPILPGKEHIKRMTKS